ncbi:MAG: hypothetical protein CMK59_01600 [Proteobacteria bacterium]|nr:hypothetical protein [Pseudomonadota bacterium]
MLVLSFLVSNLYAGAASSSFKEESRKSKTFWSASSAIDGNVNTAWMIKSEELSSDALDVITGDEEKSKWPRGEWIEIDGPIGVSTVSSIGMMVGFSQSEDTFTDYARVKSAKIEVYEFSSSMELKKTSKTAEVSFEDKMGMQEVAVSGIDISSEGGGKYRLIITDIYPGKDFDNVAVSEMMFYLKDFDVQPEIAESEQGVEGSDTSKMTDKSTKTYWLGNEGAKFGFDAGSATISRLSITSGSSSYARPKKIKISTGGREQVHDLANTNKAQWFWVPSVTGYSGSTWDTVYVEVLEVYPGSKSQEIAIAELGAKATGLGF